MRNHDVSVCEKYCLVVGKRRSNHSQIMILDNILSILSKSFIGVLGPEFLVRHCSFIPFNGETALCCILMYTTKKGISNYLQTVIGIFIKMDHANMKDITTNHHSKRFANAISGTNVFYFSHLLCQK